MEMHARDLVELASLVTAHGPVLVEGDGPIAATGIEQYWTASKCRLDRWGRNLRQFADEADAENTPWFEEHWPLVRGVVEEVITGEVLSRVWAAVLCAYDRWHGTNRAEPIARSVLIGQLEASHRVLTLLVQSPAIPDAKAIQLNRLRQRTERWTDLLVGYLTGVDEVTEFAIDPGRARDFAEDLRYQGPLPEGRKAWPILQASLRAALATGLGSFSPNADLNGQIAASVVACFPPELFDATGIFRSLWALRLANATADAQGLIDELLALE